MSRMEYRPLTNTRCSSWYPPFDNREGHPVVICKEGKGDPASLNECYGRFINKCPHVNSGMMNPVTNLKKVEQYLRSIENGDFTYIVNLFSLNAVGARLKMTIAFTALAQGGFSWRTNRSCAKKYRRNGARRTVKRSVARLFAFPRSMSSIKRDVKKKLLPGPEERGFLEIQPAVIRLL